MRAFGYVLLVPRLASPPAAGFLVAKAERRFGETAVAADVRLVCRPVRGAPDPSGGFVGTKTLNFSGKTAVVVSDVIGIRAGAYLAALLLCQELRRLRLEVTCFAEFMDFGGAQPPADFRIVQPWLTRGCRWGWPGRCLAWQVRCQVKRDRPDFVFVCSLTRLTRHLLQTNLADQLLIWESTNANPGNKFVDVEASRMVGRARAVLSPSASIDQNIRQNYGYQGRILRLPFWIEDRPGACSSPLAEVLADFIYLGRRDEEKGLRELIAATAVVRRSFPRVKVLIAGSGSADPFSGLARQLGVSDNVVFRFFPGREETLRALADSRWLVLPSYHEGYPLVLLEAAQCGVPFIATRVGSVAELYGSTQAARLVAPRDERALAAAMLEALAEPPSSYDGRRTAARRVFQKLSSSEVVGRNLSQLLRSGSSVNPAGRFRLASEECERCLSDV